jgi:hypothetical protein
MGSENKVESTRMGYVTGVCIDLNEPLDKDSGLLLKMRLQRMPVGDAVDDAKGAEAVRPTVTVRDKAVMSTSGAFDVIPPASSNHFRFWSCLLYHHKTLLAAPSIQPPGLFLRPQTLPLIIDCAAARLLA